MMARRITADICIALVAVWSIIIGFFGGFYAAYGMLGETAKTNTFALVMTITFGIITACISFGVVTGEIIDWFYAHEWIKE